MKKARSSKIVISLPPKELAEFAITGTIFPIDELQDVVLKPELRSALALIVEAFSPRHPPLCIVRPEIFTHGASRKWLDQRIASVTDHVCLSDGHAAKIIPGLKNHLFIYGLGRQAGLVAFERLAGWAAELFCQYETQINSAHRFFFKNEYVTPTTRLVQPMRGGKSETVDFRPFYFGNGPFEQSASRMMEAELYIAPYLPSYARVTYVPLTETALFDHFFCKTLGQLLLSAYFDSSHCVILRLPFIDKGSTISLSRFVAVLAGLNDAAIKFPRLVASNIYFVDDDPPDDFFAAAGSTLDLMTHESWEFWKYPDAFYKKVGKIICCPHEFHRENSMSVSEVLKEKKIGGCVQLEPLVSRRLGAQA